MTPRSNRDVAGVIVATPSAVALRMLQCMYGAEPAQPRAADLATFQQDALEQLHRIISRRGGAILADSVGLGKTHVAAAIIRSHAGPGRVVVTGPASLAAHWRKHLHGIDGWRWYSHTTLSRAGVTQDGARLVVVDEAHAFRNPATRRYAALSRLCSGADVLLLTATPVNNSLMDFYHLVRIFARDHSFTDVGVPDLHAAAVHAAAGGDPGALRTSARAVMVRRTRDFVQQHHGRELRSAAGALRFPDREPLRTVHYDLDAAYPGLAPVLARALAALTFPAHGTGRVAAPTELLRLGLLKRLESSSAALVASLRAHERLLHEFIAAAESGFHLDARTCRALMPEVEGSVQLAMRDVAMRPWPPDRDADGCVQLATADLKHIRRLLALIASSPAVGSPDATSGGGTAAVHDPKLAALRDLVLGDYAADRILIFTEFRHTARRIWDSLCDVGGVALIVGNDARLGRGAATRAAVLRRFAPRAAGARTVPRHQQVRVLVATDVLAEGLNLQDARVVISYDVPWNPMRMAQRFGRVDRLGSPHASVASVVFAPDRKVDALLRLMRRVRRKLRHARIVGGDDAWTGAVARTDTLCGGYLQSGERMRLAWQQRLGSTPEARAAGGPDTALPIAAMQWSERRRGALLCVSDGRSARLVLCRARRPVDVHADDAAALVLAALDIRLPASASPDTDWIAASARRALHAVRRLDQPPPGATGIAAVRAARTVHHWLARRPGGPAAPDCARADSILSWLDRVLDISAEHDVARALRLGGGDAAVVRRLERLAAAGVSSAQSADASELPRNRHTVVAALDLVAMAE